MSINIMPSDKAAKASSGTIMTVVFEIVLATALIPVIKTFIVSAANLTATETLLLGLVTLFLVLGLIYSVARQTGLVKSG